MSLIQKEDEPLERYLLSRPDTHHGWSLIMGIKAVMEFEMGWTPPEKREVKQSTKTAQRMMKRRFNKS